MVPHSSQFAWTLGFAVLVALIVAAHIGLLNSLVVAIAIWNVTEHTPIGRYREGFVTSESNSKKAIIRPERLRSFVISFGGVFTRIIMTVRLFKAQLKSPRLGPDLRYSRLIAACLSGAAFKLGTFNVQGAIHSNARVQFGITGLI